MKRNLNDWENIDVEFKRNYIITDCTKAISSYGVIFKVGDEVQHEGVEDENETAIIERFESSLEDGEVIVHTTRGHCKLDFLMHKN